MPRIEQYPTRIPGEIKDMGQIAQKLTPYSQPLYELANTIIQELEELNMKKIKHIGRKESERIRAFWYSSLPPEKAKEYARVKTFWSSGLSQEAIEQKQTSKGPFSFSRKLLSPTEGIDMLMDTQENLEKYHARHKP